MWPPLEFVWRMLQGINSVDYAMNFRRGAVMKQIRVNFAARLSIIYRIQSKFVKYAQTRVNQSTSEMCA
jgi:hypothetical protein